MKIFNIKLFEKKELQLDMPIIFLNYCPNDTVYVNPIKHLMEIEKIDYMDSPNDFEKLTNIKVVINIVTTKFYENHICMQILEKANAKGIKIISICVNDGIDKKLLGEIISLKEINESVEEYMMTALYYKVPFCTYIGTYADEIRRVLMPKLNKAISIPQLSIGNNDTFILAIGSMGYSTVNSWIDQGFNIESKLVYVIKNESVEKGQPLLLKDAQKWVVGLENKDNLPGDVFISKIEAEIANYLNSNIKEKKLVLIGGLGKTASLLIPLILKQANKIGIDTNIVCSMPIGFEGIACKKLADMSLLILEKMSNKICCIEDIAEIANMMGKGTSLKDVLDLIAYAIGIAINEELESDEKENRRIKIVPNNKLNELMQTGVYGKYKVSII